MSDKIHQYEFGISLMRLAHQQVLDSGDTVKARRILEQIEAASAELQALRMVCLQEEKMQEARAEVTV